MSEVSDQPPTWSESDLAELADFIRGEGRFKTFAALWGKGIHVYPGHSLDAGKYDMCCELKRRGLVSRTELTGSVFFGPPAANPVVDHDSAI